MLCALSFQLNFYNMPSSPPPPAFELEFSPFCPRLNPSKPPPVLCPFVCLRRPFAAAFGFCCRWLLLLLLLWPSKLMPSSAPPSVPVNVPVKFVVVDSSAPVNWFKMNAHDTSFDDGCSAAPHSDNWQNLENTNR